MENNKDLLKLIYKHTHIKDENGEDVPFFCFVRDIVDTVDFDMSEEQIAQVALDNGYKVYKAFPEETMVGGLILCAEGCLKEAIDKMYQEFYGEVPTIEEWPLKEEIKEEKEEVDLEPLNPEVEAKKGSEQFMSKFIDKAASYGAKIEFYQGISPQRLDSIWYFGKIALLEYNNFEILIACHGDVKMFLDGVDGALRDAQDLEENGIFTDEQLESVTQDNSLYFDAGNWFDFSIKKKNSSVWIYSDELGYDNVGDLKEILDIKFYIDIVIPDVIERYYRTNEGIELEPSKDLPFNYEEGHTLEEYMDLYGKDYEDGFIWDYSLEDLLYYVQEDGEEEYKDRIFWLIDDRFYEIPKQFDESLTEESEDLLEPSLVSKVAHNIQQAYEKSHSWGSIIVENVVYVIADDVSGFEGVLLDPNKDYRGIWSIYKIEGDDTMSPVIQYNAKPSTIQDLHLIGKEPLSYFAGREVKRYANFMELFAELAHDFGDSEIFSPEQLTINEGKNKDPRLVKAGVSGYNQPKRTPNHPTKSHIVVAKEGDKIKTIRFGEQGAKTAGKPKKGESERMKAKRKSFKARHAKNIKKGKMSAAYWADKVKW